MVRGVDVQNGNHDVHANIHHLQKDIVDSQNTGQTAKDHNRQRIHDVNYKNGSDICIWCFQSIAVSDYHRRYEFVHFLL